MIETITLILYLSVIAFMALLIVSIMRRGFSERDGNKERVELNQRISELEKELKRKKDLVPKNKELSSINVNLSTQLQETQKKIREQTEADLFFVSQKICKELLDGKTKEELKSEITYQRSLQERLAQTQQRQQQVGLGVLGNMVGRIF